MDSWVMSKVWIEQQNLFYDLHNFLDAECDDTFKMTLDERINARAEVEECKVRWVQLNGIKRLFGHAKAGKSTSKDILRQ